MLLTGLKQVHLELDNFHGPLEFLYQLIQRHELNIHDIPLKSIASQFLTQLMTWERPDVNTGAEFVGTYATLTLFKSRALLPHQSATSESGEEEAETNLRLLEQLVEYCRIKEIAGGLAQREERLRESYPRGLQPQEPVATTPSTGLERLTLDQLAAIFRAAMQRALPVAREIYAEAWKVSDKIQWLKGLLTAQPSLPVAELFTVDRSRPELIVTFLAILELMKGGVARLQCEETNGQLLLCA